VHYMGASPGLLRGATGETPDGHRQREGSVAEAEAGGGSGSAAIVIGYAINRTKDTQLHKPNRLWLPRRVMGDSPDSRRYCAGLGDEERRRKRASLTGTAPKPHRHTALVSG
jgi:hypothetical protein